MRNNIFPDIPKIVKTDTGKWVRIFPDNGASYRLYDPLGEAELGRILFDAGDHWIYDGEVLTVGEQEEVAAAISGHEQEMVKLLRSLHDE
jgi:hypothetical protein